MKLKRGDVGGLVMKLQNDLNRLHFHVGKADGFFGERTEGGVKRIQKAYGLKQTGIAGDGVQARIARNGQLSAHFRVEEFASKGNGDLLLDRGLIRGLEKLRGYLGVPITVHSGYRDPLYNKSIGGAKNSYHMRGMAADITARNKSIADIIHAAAAVGFKGIGRYRTFVHVDVRATPARWNG